MTVFICFFVIYILIISCHIFLRFTDTQSHHVVARKEKQLETLRAALGLNVEDAKKGDVESDVESGELVPGKYYEELVTVGENNSKDSKNAKKSKKKKENDKRRQPKSSRKSKYDSGHDHITQKRRRVPTHHDSEDGLETDYNGKEKKHDKKRHLGSVDNSENDWKKAERGKNSYHDIDYNSSLDS